MRKGWIFSMFLQLFLFHLSLSSSFNCLCLLVQPFSISCLQVQSYGKKSLRVAQFCQENFPIPKFLLMQKQDLVSSDVLLARRCFVSDKVFSKTNKTQVDCFFSENQLISQCKGWCSNFQWQLLGAVPLSLTHINRITEGDIVYDCERMLEMHCHTAPWHWCPGRSACTAWAPPGLSAPWQACHPQNLQAPWRLLRASQWREFAILYGFREQNGLRKPVQYTSYSHV